MMTNKRTIFVMILTLIATVGVSAQSDARSQMNAIKRNTECIWGQSSGEDYQSAYELAQEQFVAKVNDYVQSDPTLNSASAIIMNNVQNKAQAISFERGMNVMVVCVYIDKNDLIPLFQGDQSSENITILQPRVDELIIPILESEVEQSQSQSETKTIDKETVSKNCEQIPFDNQTKDIATLQSINEESLNPTNTESVNLENFVENPILQSTKKEDQVSPMNQEVQTPIPNISNANHRISDNDVLNDLLGYSHFRDQYAYLDNRKEFKHDIMFKAYPKYDPSLEGFWIIYDQNRRMIAILNPKRNINLIDNSPVVEGTYDNRPTIWLKTF